MSYTTVLRNDSICVRDYRCGVRPGDAPFDEVHGAFSLSYVRKGHFTYHAGGDSFELVPGALLVGRPGVEYRCTHDHFYGDECLSFTIDTSLAEALDEGYGVWKTYCIPPVPELMVLGELAQASVEQRSDVGADEVGLLIAARFVEIVRGRKQRWPKARTRDRRRVIEAALRMDAHNDETITLESASREAGLSEFHFLRVFTNLLGVTPHQYVVRSRLRRAAHLLAGGAGPISDVALTVGFADLSNFVRTFHRAAGVTPTTFREVARRKRGMTVFAQESPRHRSSGSAIL